MTESSSKPVGNLLGAARAEVDAMLPLAFVETAAYRALLQRSDYNFVVGRRGTGKSALFTQLAKQLSSAGNTILATEIPQEHQVIEFQNLLTKSAGLDYRLLRAISRLVWRASLLGGVPIAVEIAARLPVIQ